MSQESNKTDRRKKYKNRLPNTLIHIKNKDKADHEHWYANRNFANFPKPFRLICCGSVNSSKTNTIKNIILRCYPRFENIILIHCNPEHTKEYDDVGLTDQFCDEIPPKEYFNELEGRTLVVIEDVEFSEKRCPGLSLLFRNLSTHNNVSVALAYQDFIKIPTIARRLASQFVVWKLPDQVQMNMIEKRVGMKKGELVDLMGKVCKHRRDSICIDLSDDSPAPLRLNIFDKITRVVKE
jgi:hypothetical protein